MEFLFFAAIVEEPDLMRNAIVTTGIGAVKYDVMKHVVGVFVSSHKVYEM